MEINNNPSISIDKLNNGITLAGERLKHLRSVSIGIWVKSGSAFETTANNGLSHFLEHMVFKGTQKRTAKDISVQIDSVGGSLNAYTTKEFTCYYVRIVDEHIEFAIDLLTDIVFHPKLNGDDMDKERAVICEEISMANDTPDDIIHDMLAQAAFRDHSLGRTILGESSKINSYTTDDLKRFQNKMYRHDDIVISIAGNYEKSKIMALIEKSISKQTTISEKPSYDICSNMQGITKNTVTRDIEQAHICMAYNGYKMGHDDNYTLMILNNLVGGSMSSRLFQSIREKHGLAYSVYSYAQSYINCGRFIVYLATNPTNVEKALNLMSDEFEGIIKSGFANDEFMRAKEQLKGNYILSLDSLGNRMSAIGRGMLMRGRVLSEQQIIEKINAVTQDDLKRVISHVLDSKDKAAAYLGNEIGEKHFNAIIGG